MQRYLKKTIFRMIFLKIIRRKSVYCLNINILVKFSFGTVIAENAVNK